MSIIPNVSVGILPSTLIYSVTDVTITCLWHIVTSSHTHTHLNEYYYQPPKRGELAVLHVWCHIIAGSTALFSTTLRSLLRPTSASLLCVWSSAGEIISQVTHRKDIMFGFAVEKYSRQIQLPSYDTNTAVFRLSWLQVKLPEGCYHLQYERPCLEVSGIAVRFLGFQANVLEECVEYEPRCGVVLRIDVRNGDAQAAMIACMVVYSKCLLLSSSDWRDSADKGGRRRNNARQ